MKVSIISFTLNGIELSLKIKKEFPKEELLLYTKCSHAEKNLVESGISYVEETLSEWTGNQMREHRSLLFIGACGIAVRAIAPFLTDKLNDVPVLVMDEQGRFVIPILAGHVGGANEFALFLAKRMQSTPVITTATDLNDCFAVDLFAKRNALHIVNKDGIAKVSSRILAGEEVTMAVEEGHLQEEVPADILVASAAYGEGRLLTLRPKEYVIGIGCRKGKEAEQIDDFVQRVLKESGILIEQVAAFTSIDRKKDEEGILWMSSHYGIPFVTYSAEELQQVVGNFHASDFVKSQVGVDNVCERAALRFSGPSGTLIMGKQAENGITVAIAKRRWSVSFYEK